MVIRPLPRTVHWTQRDRKTKMTGKVVKEAAVVEKFEWGDYCKVIQEVKDDSGKSFIRFGYYKKNHNAPDEEYSWGSQSSLAISKKNLLRLLRLAKAGGII
jgi:hypothetical protein